MECNSGIKDGNDAVSIVAMTWAGESGLEASYGGRFAVLSEAIQEIERRAAERPNCRVWINDMELLLRDGRIMDLEGRALSEGHERSFPASRRPPADLPESATVYVEEMNAILRDKPFRPDNSRAPSVGRLLMEGKL